MLSPRLVEEREREKVVDCVNKIAAAFQRLGIMASDAITSLGLSDFLRWLSALLAWGRGEKEEKPPPISLEQADAVKKTLREILDKKLTQMPSPEMREECALWVRMAYEAIDDLTASQGV